MHGYMIFHGSDINGNDNFKETKPILHAYKRLHRGDLNERENFKKENYAFYCLGSKD